MDAGELVRLHVLTPFPPAAESASARAGHEPKPIYSGADASALLTGINPLLSCYISRLLFSAREPQTGRFRRETRPDTRFRLSGSSIKPAGSPRVAPHPPAALVPAAFISAIN